MNKAKLKFRWYRFAHKTGCRFSSWYKLLGTKLRVPKERMSMITIPIEKQVDAPGQKIMPMDIVDVLIEWAAGHAIINNCQCRVGGRCEDYPHDIACLVLGDAVEKLDPYIGRIVTKDEARAHVKKALDNKLYPMISHYERDAMMFSLDYDRLLIVCFCCPCHCVLRNAAKFSDGLDNSFHSNTDPFPGVSIAFDASKCNGCGKCVDECFANAITMKDGKAVIDMDKCKTCGHCAYICDAYSVRYNIEDVEKTIAQLHINSDIF